MCKRIVLIFLCLIAVGYCQNNFGNFSFHRNCRKKHHHDPFHHLIYGGGLFYYLSFLLIKIKVVFVLGTIFTIFLVTGKVYGLIKYIDYIKHKDYHHHHHEPEKIYIQGPNHDYHHHPPSHHDSIQYSAPPPNGYSGGYTVDKLPPNAEIAGGGGAEYNSPPPGYTGGYGRSNKEDTYEKFKYFIKMLKTLDTTDIAFNTMKLQTDVCKKRFVCKAEYESRHSLILATALNWLSDEKYNSYKPNQPISSLEDCERLYPNCSNNKI